MSESILPSSTGMIIRQREPRNLETPSAALAEFCTSNEYFYVRCHFAIPEISASDYRLRLDGRVDRDMEFTLDQLRQMPATTKTVTLECAGNGRVFLSPQVAGAQWELGAVSTAEWTGVPLSALLEQAGLKPDAIEVVLEGTDRGKPSEPPTPPHEISYARSLPLAKARGDVLLAYEMNGKPLTPSHGFPLRAIVPEWYGMASVKWLCRILVVDRPFQGYFQTTDYAYWSTVGGLPVRIPITEMQLKAHISQPAPYQTVPRNSDYRILGAAWSGLCAVSQVEISTDGGKTFTRAKLLGNQLAATWRLWEYTWRTPAHPGSVTLMARAIDEAGNIQPSDHDPSWGTYVICHTLPIEVTVE